MLYQSIGKRFFVSGCIGPLSSVVTTAASNTNKYMQMPMLLSSLSSSSRMDISGSCRRSRSKCDYSSIIYKRGFAHEKQLKDKALVMMPSIMDAKEGMIVDWHKKEVGILRASIALYICALFSK